MQAVRTKNVKQGGRNARKAKKKKKERKISRTVKQQQTLMFHGIPGKVNSCTFVPSHFMNQVVSVFGSRVLVARKTREKKKK